MVTLIDTLQRKPSELRHPEKQNRPKSVVLKKPDWLRVKAPGSGQYNATKDIVRSKGLVTVCEEAACPNIGECWSQKHATLMIMGDTCTGPAPSATSRRACPSRWTRRSRARWGWRSSRWG